MNDIYKGSIFVIMKSKADIEDIRLLELKKDDFVDLRELLLQNVWKVKSNVSEFNGQYKPEFDESLVINNFDLPKEIKNAIDNPLSLDSLSLNIEDIENIKSILFVEKKQKSYAIVGQKFKKSQYLASRFLKILWDKKTFLAYKNPGLNITDTVDCYYGEGNLYFKSYYVANQILDLSSYYREATDDDLRCFSNIEGIAVEDTNDFMQSKKWVRKKIAAVIDSKVLEEYSVKDIINESKSLGLEINVQDDKIIFPKDSNKQKELLKFLLDEIYKGCFSNNVFETNSKKNISQTKV